MGLTLEVGALSGEGQIDLSFEHYRSNYKMDRPHFGSQAASASSLRQVVTSPRLLRPRSYSRQFRIQCFVLYWRLTRLEDEKPFLRWRSKR